MVDDLEGFSQRDGHVQLPKGREARSTDGLVSSAPIKANECAIVRGVR